MKKTVVSVLAALLAATVIAAPRYRIVRLASPPVVIGGKKAVVGDYVTVDELKDIKWGQNKYVQLTVENAGKQTGRRIVLTDKTTPKDLTRQLMSVVPLSTRGGGEVPVVRLREQLSQTFYLLNDTCSRLTLDLDLPLDSGRHVEVMARNNRRRVATFVPSVSDATVTLSAADFSSLLHPIGQSTDILVTVNYIDPRSATIIPLTESMNIVVIEP